MHKIEICKQFQTNSSNEEIKEFISNLKNNSSIIDSLSLDFSKIFRYPYDVSYEPLNDLFLNQDCCELSSLLLNLLYVQMDELLSIFKSIQKLPKLKHLQFIFYSIEPFQIKEPYFMQIERLSLRFLYLNVQNINFLTSFLENCYNLKELDLSLQGCTIQNQGVIKLSKSLSLLKSQLNKLNLNLCMVGTNIQSKDIITFRGIRMLTKFLKSCENLDYFNLNLIGNQLDDVSCKKIFKCLNGMKQLNKLEFYSNEFMLDEEEFLDVDVELEEQLNMQELILKIEFQNEQSMKSISNWLNQFQNLQKLILSISSITSAPYYYTSKLKNLEQLREISLIIGYGPYQTEVIQNIFLHVGRCQQLKILHLNIYSCYLPTIEGFIQISETYLILYQKIIEI